MPGLNRFASVPSKIKFEQLSDALFMLASKRGVIVRF